MINRIELDVSLVCMLIYTGWVICLIAFGTSVKEYVVKGGDTSKYQLIIMVPAMNEAGVIVKTIERFLTSTKGMNNVSMAIIDDASDDGTPALIKQTIYKHHCQYRVQLLSRSFPAAQQGKGSALNWAYHRLIDEQQMTLRKTIIGVLDADAYMTRAGYQKVLDNFAQKQDLDLLQTRVGMITIHNWLQLFQDIEFNVINDWIQNTRNRLGNAAASGNGQFIRVSSIHSYNPWGNALLEDFEFSTRFLLRGRTTFYATDIVVFQEAIDKIRPFIRQRARWTQGGLDCLFSYWPAIIRSPYINWLAKLEMSFYMFIPFVTLTAGVAGFYVLGFVIIHISTYVPVLVSLILLNCIINSIILTAYQQRGHHHWVVIGLSIIFLGVYNYLLYPAIIIAFINKVRGQHSWAKTVHGKKKEA